MIGLIHSSPRRCASLARPAQILALTALSIFGGCKKEEASKAGGPVPQSVNGTSPASQARDPKAPQAAPAAELGLGAEGSQIPNLPKFTEGAVIDVSAYGEKIAETLQAELSAAIKVMALDPDLSAALGEQRGMVVPFNTLDDLAEKLVPLMSKEQAEKAIAGLKAQNADAATFSIGVGDHAEFHGIFIQQSVFQKFSKFVAVLNHELWRVSLVSTPGWRDSKTEKEQMIDAYSRSVASLQKIHSALKSGQAVINRKMTQKLVDELGERIDEESSRKESWESLK